MPIARSIGRNLFKMMAGKGYRPMALIRMAEARGGTYQKKTMLTDIRKFEGRVKHETQIMALAFDAKVPKSWMVETDLGNQGRYRVHGMATFYDEDIDDYFQQRVSFYTNEWNETGQYGMNFSNTFRSLYMEEGLEFTEFEQKVLEHNETWDY